MRAKKEKTTAETQRAQRWRGDQHVILRVFSALSASPRLHLVLRCAVIVLLAGSTAIALPFFYPGATSVEPQISTLLVGVQENIQQANVSQDRKYVTMDMNISNNSFLGITAFTYQQGGLGFVGSQPATPVAPPTNGNSMTPTIARTPSQVVRPVSILDKRGMVLVAPLER